jgi:hypothetical protein
MEPVAAVVAFEFSIRFVIIDNTARRRVPPEATAKLHRHVGENTTGRRDVAFFDVGHRPLLFAARGKEVFEMPARGRRGE